MNIRSVQQQGNGVDWRLFATAFAVTLAFGNKLEVITYDESNLRRHLSVECLKSKKFSPFPEYKNNKRVKRARAVTIKQDVHFVCCRTYFKKDTNDSTDKFMASCCVCYE